MKKRIRLFLGDLTRKNVHIAEVEILHTVNIIVIGHAIIVEGISDEALLSI